jgi:hypothetical protein
MISILQLFFDVVFRKILISLILAGRLWQFRVITEMWVGLFDWSDANDCTL